ncbi:hypothetical protein Fcan01_07712 [Folsomia candida]|uniref:DUF4789 domain-containing protein n=1 Tax=Folsomia candida TaxID=158441 RepID=A0A226EL14_FOLCA|nr:hypothetical protein Fcan01_07712 [Folsomia candida]
MSQRSKLVSWFIQCFAISLISGWVVNAEEYKLKSAPECPTIKNQVWLLDADNVCHQVGSQGPCGSNMLFFPHPSRADKTHGFCDCFDARMETEDEIQVINNPELSHCLKFELRSQIFVPERNRCYSAFDQGPCPSGKWLVLNETYYPICARHQCESGNAADPLSARFKFSHSAADKRCYETMARGYCPKFYRLRFSPNDWLPKCRYSPRSLQSPIACPATKLWKGTIRSRWEKLV